jgi:hypothetical protein
MATVINNPDGNRDNSAMSGGSGVFVGAALVILVLVVVIILSLPYIRQQIDGMTKPTNPTINVTLPNPPTPQTPPDQTAPTNP